MRATVMAALIVVVVAGVAGWVVLAAQTESYNERQRLITLSSDRVSSLAKFIVARMVTPGDRPRYTGKALILSGFVHGDLDPRRRENLEILFSPTRGKRAVDAVDVTEYEGLTSKHLLAGDGLAALTDFVATRRASDCIALPDGVGVPIVADPTIEGVVVIGFDSGAVKVMTYEELRLPANGPVVLGPDSPSDILRCLSDR